MAFSTDYVNMVELSLGSDALEVQDEKYLSMELDILLLVPKRGHDTD